MRIGFDVSPLARPHPTGVVRATRGLVECLERRGRIEVVRLAPPPGTRIGRWRQTTLAAAPARLALAGLHSPVSSFALAGRGARVATIHEVPWARGARENADARHRLWCALGPLRADGIVCPSRSTRAHVADASPLAAHKLHVASWGVDPVFGEPPGVSDSSARARVGLAGLTYVLAVGATREKKNVAAALRALDHAEPDVHLAVTGPLTADFVADLARSADPRRVRILGTLDEGTLAAVTRGALASVVLSISEGFGLPVVEAQAAGTPVVVARGSTQAEIAGGAAIEVDPDDASAVAVAWHRARAEREAWAALGRANAARYTWDRCAATVEDLWSSLA